MSEIFWGNKPSDHHPMIGRKQFHLEGAFGDKATAERVAKGLRENGLLARVQKKSITSTFGNKRRVVNHAYVVFKAHSGRK
jgi:hypothetical protein